MALSDFTREKGWDVDSLGVVNWSLVKTPSPPDNLTFEGSGGGAKTDIINKNGSFLCEEWHYNHPNAPGDKVRVSFEGDWYIITRTTSPTQLTCREEGAGSGNISWTAVEGG